MKKTILILLILLSSAFGDINWAEDIEDAYEIAQKSDKKVMVMLSQKECPACEYMEGIVFQDKNVESYFNKNFIAVHVDIREDFVPSGLEYFATPTLYFLNADEKKLHRINGAMNAKDFLEELEEIKTQQ